MARKKSSRSTSKLDEINELLAGLGGVSEELESEVQKDTDTRQKIARIFVYFYFAIMIIVIIGVPAYNATMYALAGNNELAISLKDTILTYSAVVGPTVGLVVAYYFKSKQEF